MWFRKLYLRIFKPYRVRDVRFVSYTEADELIRSDKNWFVHAEKEDNNFVSGKVWIERRDYITE